MIENTYIFQCSKDNVNNSQEIFKNCYLKNSFSSASQVIIHEEDENFRIDAFGHFYFSNSKNIYPYSDSNHLLKDLSISNPIEFLNSIAGGLYSIWILDKKNNKLYASTENFGATALYWKATETSILLSNNQFALNSECNFDEMSSFEFLIYGYLPLSDSLFALTKRLQPNKLIMIDLKTIKLMLVDKKSFAYLAPKNRYSNQDEILEKMQKAFQEYFERIMNLDSFFGLSGGYDSRLIAAYLKNTNSHAIHYMNSDLLERKAASLTAKLSNLPLQMEIFPEEAPTLYHDNMRYQYLSISSFEYSHVLHLQENAKLSNAKFYVDGYIGDTIFGGTYFEAKRKNIFYLLKYLFFQESKDEPLPEDIHEWNKIISDREILDYSKMDFLPKDSIKNHIELKTKEVLGSIKENIYTKEDLMEKWKHVTRARCMISMGPTGINLFMPACVPFLDNKILEICLNTTKNLRSMDRLYNLFWKKYFLEYAKIAKARTGSYAIYGNFVFRLHHIFNTLYKKFYEFFFSTKDRYIDTKSYVFSDKNSALWMNLRSDLSKLPLSIREYIEKSDFNSLVKDERFFLRLMSLCNYARKTE
ncbi:MAG: hypothetical protein CK427_10405 [Leptospira sp.]|nr:MAG: hypothetical protein CK427_10405 [Leptospira sp.]